LPGMSLTLFHESLQKGGFSTFVENLNFNHIRKMTSTPHTYTPWTVSGKW
jgi:hypothetical protein